MASPTFGSDALEDNINDTPSTALPSRPNKRKATNNEESDDDQQASTPKKAKLQRRRNSKIARILPIAESYEEAAEHDKMLFDQREAGKAWPLIRAEWTRLTGEEVKSSTLPNRYIRLKANFTQLPREDQALLIASKQEVEDDWDEKKWGFIATRMREKSEARARELDGGAEDVAMAEAAVQYAPETLCVQYRHLMQNAENLPAAREAAGRRNRWEERVLRIVDGVEEEESD
ncbi:hypothetical protein BDY17DRAFT_43952 [Neohortaea acidophila]|uniref:Uncharacterized protein n=1 Tax=Neohortaea acidophila TaxID=245834 RepID=A0A6A6PI62_9PEZI|nr:uncharacterized protein BDY17DRAFT_43952 [Neohortaea acidophila]KAF2479699.1 hypothetical protein BDY17DRAFT_43952 [Neohortaea acidophila]